MMALVYVWEMDLRVISQWKKTSGGIHKVQYSTINISLNTCLLLTRIEIRSTQMRDLLENVLVFILMIFFKYFDILCTCLHLFNVLPIGERATRPI